VRVFYPDTNDVSSTRLIPFRRPISSGRGCGFLMALNVVTSDLEFVTRG
jgi:hypothetical protein